MNPKSEVQRWIRAFETTETLRTTEGTEIFDTDDGRTFPCLRDFLSELSGSQCFSGFPAGSSESTSESGMKTQKMPLASALFSSGRSEMSCRRCLALAARAEPDSGNATVRKHETG
jgi:hypothetical protein